MRINKENIPTFFWEKKCNLFMLFILLTNISCKKFVEISPPATKLSSESVFSNNASAAAVLTGVYDNMIFGSSKFSSGYYSISLLGGLAADEFIKYSTDLTHSEHYVNAITSTNVRFWIELYNYIYTANAALEGIENSKEVTPLVKQQLTGEAKFIRAFCYFYLVNLFGDVPLITTTDYRLNALAARAPTADVYQQIINDLNDAKNLLTENYVKADAVTTTLERVRPNKWAATALLARVYLYTGEWVNAEAQATSVIDNNSMYSLNTDLNSVFLKNSTEAIWQLQPVQSGYNTYEGYYFILTSDPNNGKPVTLSSFLLNAFEIGDIRKKNWVGSYTSGIQIYYYANKYKIGTLNQPITEYLMVLRLAELYLIRAEARAQLNKLNESKNDLNSIRLRAGLGPNTETNKASLLSAIIHERQVEMFTEWGHRWLDLKRTGTVNSVMGTACIQKGGAWNANWAFFPIPLGEIQKDFNLAQNPGYQ